MSTGQPLAFDLRQAVGAPLPPHRLREVLGHPNQVATTCTLAYIKDALHVIVRCEDPDMPGLVTSISPPNTDKLLYEEDCVQIALGLAGQPAPVEFCIINAHGSRKGSAAALGWKVETQRDAGGWTLELHIPMADSTSCLGLSLHRFYRGIRNEVQGLGSNLPHPLQPHEFPVLVLRGEGDVADIATSYRQSTQAAAQREITIKVTAVRQRLKVASEPQGPAPGLAAAEALARGRAEMPVRPATEFLCWNEGHFQNALVDLWHLTGSREWIDIAVERMAAVWPLRGTERGQPDSLWEQPLPTWYNEKETGTACTLVSGVILLPIARLMRAAHDEARLADVWERVQEWLPMMDEVLMLHDAEWVEFSDGSGMHLEPYPKGPRRVYPNGGSRINPLNREFLFTMPMLHMARVTGNAEYLRKATMNALFFKNSCDVTPDECLCWEYEKARYPAEGEDIDHAMCQVAFAQLCYEEGVVIDATDMQRMANTLQKLLFRYGDVPCGTLRGFRPGLHIGAGMWSVLCRYAPAMFPVIEAVVTTAMRENDRHFTAEHGWGVRILTTLEKARRSLQQ